MDLSLDHVVHYSNDVQSAVETFQAEGLHAVMGGSHKQWGTHNGLSHFGLTYIEWLGIEDETVLKRSRGRNPVFQDAYRLLPESPVLHKMAIRTPNIEGILQSLQQKGIQTSGILANSRVNREGQLIRWKMLILENQPGQIPYPFFIEWEESDDERLRNLERSGVAPNRIEAEVRISDLVFHTPDPVQVTKEWAWLFGLRIISEDDGILEIDGVRLLFREGDENRLTSVIITGIGLNDKRMMIEGSDYELVSEP